jgi:hypothetical protein
MFNAPYNFHLKVKLSSYLLKHHAIKTYESVQHQASVVSGQVYDPTALNLWTDISVNTGWVEADWAAEPMSTLPRIKPQSIDSPARRLHTVSQISVTLSADPSTKFNSQSVNTFRGKTLPLSLYSEKFCTNNS